MIDAETVLERAVQCYPLDLELFLSSALLLPTVVVTKPSAYSTVDYSPTPMPSNPDIVCVLVRIWIASYHHLGLRKLG